MAADAIALAVIVAACEATNWEASMKTSWWVHYLARFCSNNSTTALPDITGQLGPTYQ